MSSISNRPDASKAEIVRAAALSDLDVSSEDIQGPVGAHTIDGMPWHEWLDAMTAE